MSDLHQAVGDGTHVRTLRERGSALVEDVQVVGDVPALLTQVLTELRKQSRMLAALIGEDFDDDE